MRRRSDGVDVVAFPWSLIVVIRYAVVGCWTISFRFLAFFPSGVVECVANLLLASFCGDASSHISLLIAHLFCFITFHVDGDCNFWSWSMSVIFVDWCSFSIGEEFVVVT